MKSIIPLMMLVTATIIILVQIGNECNIYDYIAAFLIFNGIAWFIIDYKGSNNNGNPKAT